MNEDKEKLKTALESNEAFLAFLAQEARSEKYRKLKHTKEPGGHPSTEMLRDYVSDQLDEEKTERVMRHLAVCKFCNDEMQMLRAIESESAAETEEDIAGLVNRLPDWVERLKKIVSDMVSAYHELTTRAWFKPLISGFGMAAACVMIYLANVSPNTGELLADAYQTAIEQHLTRGQSFDFPRKKDQVYGLTPSSQHHPRYRAFAAGLWAGSQELKAQGAESMPDILSPAWQGDSTVKAEKWTDTQWAVYYRTGQWSFLLGNVSLSDTDVPKDFWENQRDISDRLRKDFAAVSGRSEEEIRILNERFESVASILAHPDSISPGKKQKIARETERLINYLSPE
ncbi:MAG: hypothetical protein BWK80_52505 [Desulfobacteraceae bacterium IS3]|nr:MAG: hypothetical protein BWK80_52505 [Desulfobacteraceae bacterium IS3]